MTSWWLFIIESNKQKKFLLTSWRSLTKIAGSEAASGSICQRCGSAVSYPHLDPYQNFIDPQHRSGVFNASPRFSCYAAVSLWIQLCGFSNSELDSWVLSECVFGSFCVFFFYRKCLAKPNGKVPKRVNILSSKIYPRPESARSRQFLRPRSEWVRIGIVGGQTLWVCTDHQCCEAENIYFGSGTTDSQIRIVAPVPDPAPAPDSFVRELKITLLTWVPYRNFFMWVDAFYSYRIKIGTIHNNLFSNRHIFLKHFF